ncbi:hypothetical protein KEM54_006827 [Ascosphaera aggregata]|nr:hypothetical protein KEM54_006827 [Ascosphaera aggregata]
MEESENTPRGVFRQDAEHLNWLAESTRKVEQGQKYVRDCYRFVHLSKNPSSKSRNPAAATTTEVLGQGLPLPQQNSQISLVCSLSRVRERLELLESTTTAPAFRCFVSLYKRDKMDEAHLDDHLLIANAGSRASQQKADSMQDAKQFCAVYGQCPETPVALKYTDVFCHLYGLTPEEARGSLREGPVTDIINEHANYLMQSDQIDAGVTAAFSRFISEVRKWSYLPGIGRIIVPEYHIDEDLERRSPMIPTRIITIWLEREYLKGQSKRLVLLRPSMSYMLLKTKDTASLQGVLPDLKGTSHIFIVVNDNENVNEVEGGSHWSLLVVSVNDKRAFHYDSLCNANEFEAEALTKKIGRLVGKDLRCVPVKSSPQQSNQNDCGIYVCMIMEFLLKNRICTARRDQMVSMELEGVNLKALAARQIIFDIIEECGTEPKTS